MRIQQLLRKDEKKIKNFKVKINKDDSLDNIARNVSAQVRTVLKDEMTEEIQNSPKITTVDYRTGEGTNYGELKKAEKENSYYNLYSHINSDGNISASKTTPQRQEYVREIYDDGNEILSSRKDFEKKISDRSVTDSEKEELGRIVRVSSADKEAYTSSGERSSRAYQTFDRDKYIIEETAARVGISPSLLSSVYFKQIADKGSIENAIDRRYARISYGRLYGKPLTWDESTLDSYLNTKEGLLDFIAICLRGEAEYRSFDATALNSNQMNQILYQYGVWNDSSPAFESTISAYNEVFDDIYKKLPPKKYEVKL